MNPIIRNILAVIAGLIGGGLINIAIIIIGSKIIPLPPGVDPTNTESLKAAMHLLEPRHFISPFLAHALGTLSGAYIAACLVTSHRMKFAMGIGIFSLLGGIAASFMIPAPTWFVILDLVVAYIPMGLLGGKLAEKRVRS
jgi:hypothetical protein